MSRMEINSVYFHLRDSFLHHHLPSLVCRVRRVPTGRLPPKPDAAADPLSDKLPYVPAADDTATDELMERDRPRDLRRDLVPGETHTVRWDASGISASDEVSIFLVRGDDPVMDVLSTSQLAGEYDWTLGADVPTGRRA